MEEASIRETVKEISASLNEKGYDAVTQLVGYIISNDLGYIPDFDDNRNKIAQLDRIQLVEDILKEYIK